MDARKLRRVIAWSWIVFVCLTAPVFAQVSREASRGMHSYGDAIFLSATALSGTWTCAAGATACTGAATDAVNEGLSAGDVVLCQSGSDYVDFEVASSPAVTASSFSRTSTITTWSGDIIAEDGLVYAISGTCYIANAGGAATEKRIYDGLGNALDAAIGTASVTVRTQLNIGTSGDLDLTRSTVSTLCVSNGDGSGCDGNLSAEVFYFSGGFGQTGCTSGSAGQLSCNSYGLFSFLLATSDVGGGLAVSRSALNNGSISYEGDQMDDDELFIDWSTAFDAYDTSGAEGDITVSVEARTGTVGLLTPVLSDAPSEPVACSAANEATMAYVDDTNDTSWAGVCICANLDGTGYDWRLLSDISGTACPFF